MEHTLVLSNVTELAESLAKFKSDYLPLIQKTAKEISNKPALKKKLKNKKSVMAHTISKKFDGKTLDSLCNAIELSVPKPSGQNEPENKADKTLVKHFITLNFKANRIECIIFYFVQN